MSKRGLPQIETANFIDKQKNRKKLGNEIDSELMYLMLKVGEYLSLSYNPSSEDANFYKKIVELYNSVPDDMIYRGEENSGIDYITYGDKKNIIRRDEKKISKECDPYLL